MKKIIIAAVVTVAAVVAIIIGWGSINNANAPGDSGSDQTNQMASTDVKALVSYTLPTGWQERTCADAATYVFVIPTGATLDCAADPRAPISLLVDPRNTKDCQHLTTPAGVLSHTCKSLYIDGHKTLVSSTEYPKSEMYPKAETISDYFVDTDKGVVQIEYIFGAKGSNTYQAGFDQLVQTVKIR